MYVSLLFSNVLGYKITGFPVRIDNTKYARNAYYFNLCFVCDAWARTVQYEPVVKKLSEYLVSICVSPFTCFAVFPLLPSCFLHLDVSLSGSQFCFSVLFLLCHFHWLGSASPYINLSYPAQLILSPDGGGSRILCNFTTVPQGGTA